MDYVTLWFLVLVINDGNMKCYKLCDVARPGWLGMLHFMNVLGDDLLEVTDESRKKGKIL
jgi:hypothetical protein